MKPNTSVITEISQLESTVSGVIGRTRVIDVITNLFPAEFRSFNLYGVFGRMLLAGYKLDRKQIEHEVEDLFRTISTDG